MPSFSLMEPCYYVYMLLCSDGSYYTGITNDIVRRFAEHQSGLHDTSYTSSRRPVTLIYCKEFKYVLNAIAWEKQLKGWNRKKKEALICQQYDQLPLLAKKNFRRKKTRKPDMVREAGGSGCQSE